MAGMEKLKVLLPSTRSLAWRLGQSRRAISRGVPQVRLRRHAARAVRPAMTLRILNDHGLRGVFFVEPLFSARFGLAPLQEIVGSSRTAVRTCRCTCTPSGRTRPGARAAGTCHEQAPAHKLLLARGAVCADPLGQGAPGGGWSASAYRLPRRVAALQPGYAAALLANGITATAATVTAGTARSRACSRAIRAEPCRSGRARSRRGRIPLSVFYDRPGNLRHCS